MGVGVCWGRGMQVITEVTVRDFMIFKIDYYLS